ncbi:hypothetical protein HYY74_04570 [Candidatus Woesearchaeota archaeon]|nr:hypothetical protein [Candidatus Woesearchaeota archaeon]
MARPKNPNKRNVTLMVDGKLYDLYREFCKRKGWLISRQFELMMEAQLKEVQNVK